MHLRPWTLGFVLLFVAALMLTASPSRAQDHKYAGAKKCKTCHKKEPIGNQFGSWEKTKHAKAWSTLESEKAKEWAAEAGVADPQADEKCVKCHVTGHGVPDTLKRTSFKIEDGVQCEACHGAGNDYRKKKVMIDRDQAIAKGLIAEPEKTCLDCHNDESPAWDPQRYTLPDGSKAGFDYKQAMDAIAHPVPEGYDPLAEGEAD
jgi:hypothetical protein